MKYLQSRSLSDRHRWLLFLSSLLLNAYDDEEWTINIFSTGCWRCSREERVHVGREASATIRPESQWKIYWILKVMNGRGWWEEERVEKCNCNWTTTLPKLHSACHRQPLQQKVTWSGQNKGSQFISYNDDVGGACCVVCGMSLGCITMEWD
jgi:hypothetical protein